MGQNYLAKNVLSGSWAQIWVDGELWAECTGITAKITEGRQDVQMGIDVGSKLTSLKGEGTITVNHVYTTKKKMFQEKMKGRDSTVLIVARISDPDAVDGKTERWVFNNAVFTETPLLDMKNGEYGTKEYPFVFPATQATVTEWID